MRLLRTACLTAMWGLFLATLCLWFFSPQWIRMGWLGQAEIELHSADNYFSFNWARHTPISYSPQSKSGQFHLSIDHSSGWGNPMMRTWSHETAVFSGPLWYGSGNDGAGAYACWFAIDGWIIVTLAALGPLIWLNRLAIAARRAKARPAA